MLQIFRGLLRGVLLARPKVTTQGCRRVARSAAGLVRANPPTGHHLPSRPSPLAICDLPPAGCCSASHQLAHLRIRQCNSWRRDPPDRTTNDSHEGHQLVLQTELIDLHSTKQPQVQLDTPTERSEMHLLANVVA